MTPAPNLLADALRENGYVTFTASGIKVDLKRYLTSDHGKAMLAKFGATFPSYKDEPKVAAHDAATHASAQQAGTRVTDADVERGLHDWYRGDVWRTECTYEESDRADMRRCLESFAATLAQPMRDGAQQGEAVRALVAKWRARSVAYAESYGFASDKIAELVEELEALAGQGRETTG